MAELDYVRKIAELDVEGLTLNDIAVMLGIGPSKAQALLERASAVKMPVAGFSGADPYEICQRYAAGMIGREQLIEELIRWEYLEPGRTSGPLDDLIMFVSGSVDDLERAQSRGLIDSELYHEIGDRKEARAAGA
ncbi:MAG: hypothetical protein Q4G21_09605 [Dermabacter sp.]|nr:hypothetical protein [Dermabacter sp.]